MSADSYISCASCHVDGGHDGRVWDFTGRGEGLRRTTDLRGRSGVGHGNVHWSGNFDEIQDFEHDIRGPFGGIGFLGLTPQQFSTSTSIAGEWKNRPQCGPRCARRLCHLPHAKPHASKPHPQSERHAHHRRRARAGGIPSSELRVVPQRGSFHEQHPL